MNKTARQGLTSISSQVQTLFANPKFAVANLSRAETLPNLLHSSSNFTSALLHACPGLKTSLTGRKANVGMSARGDHTTGMQKRCSAPRPLAAARVQQGQRVPERRRASFDPSTTPARLQAAQAACAGHARVHLMRTELPLVPPSLISSPPQPSLALSHSLLPLCTSWTSP